MTRCVLVFVFVHGSASCAVGVHDTEDDCHFHIQNGLDLMQAIPGFEEAGDAVVHKSVVLALEESMRERFTVGPEAEQEDEPGPDAEPDTIH